MSGDLHSIGRLLLILGIITAVLGGLIMLAGKVPWAGRLPGDIVIHKKNFTFYFPVVTSIIISIIISIILWLIGRR